MPSVYMDRDPAAAASLLFASSVTDASLPSLHFNSADNFLPMAQFTSNISTNDLPASAGMLRMAGSASELHHAGGVPPAQAPTFHSSGFGGFGDLGRFSPSISQPGGNAMHSRLLVHSGSSPGSGRVSPTGPGAHGAFAFTAAGSRSSNGSDRDASDGDHSPMVPEASPFRAKTSATPPPLPPLPPGAAAALQQHHTAQQAAQHAAQQRALMHCLDHSSGSFASSFGGSGAGFEFLNLPGMPGFLAPAGGSGVGEAGGGSRDGGDGGGGGGMLLVVDPTTGLVVGTTHAQARGGSSMTGSLAACTPGGASLTGTATPVSGVGGGGHTPIPSSGRSSMEAPTSPMVASAPSMTGIVGMGGLGGAGASLGGSKGGADMALSLLGVPGLGSGAAGGGGSGGGAAGVANLAAAMAAESGAGGGSAVPPPSVEQLMAVLAAAASGGNGAAVLQQLAAQQQQQQQQQQQREHQQREDKLQGDASAAAFARTLDPSTAATLLQEGLATGSLTDDLMLALAQAAGLLDANTSHFSPGASSSSPPSSATATRVPAQLLNPNTAAAMAAGLPLPAASTPAAQTLRTSYGVQHHVLAPGSVASAGLPQGFATPPPASAAMLAALGAAGTHHHAAPALPMFSTPAPAPTMAASSPAAFPMPPRSTSSAATWRAAAPGAAATPGGGGAGPDARPSWLGSPAGPGAGTAPGTPVPPQGLLASLGSPRPGLGLGNLGPKHNSLYKTEMCRSWTETGSCRYGSKCQFAHGPEELRAVVRHPKYKTELCRTFATTGACHYGNRCRFIHAVPPGGPGASPRPMGPSGLPEMMSPGAGEADFFSPQRAAPPHLQLPVQQQGGVGEEGGVGAGSSPVGADGGGSGALQRNLDQLGAGLWSGAGGHGVQALPAAAASLLSPARATLLSPTNRGGSRHSLSLTSPPLKMQRTVGGGTAGGAAAVQLATGAADAAMQLFSTFGSRAAPSPVGAGGARAGGEAAAGAKGAEGTAGSGGQEGRGAGEVRAEAMEEGEVHA